MHRQHRKRGQGGFTLVELLIALTVLLIGLLGLMTVQVKTVRSGTYARRSTEAAVLAEKKMEELRTVAVSTISDGTDTSDPIFDMSWKVIGVGNPRTIEVTVSWDEKVNGTEARTVSTVLRARREWQ